MILFLLIFIALVLWDIRSRLSGGPSEAPPAPRRPAEPASLEDCVDRIERGGRLS